MELADRLRDSLGGLGEADQIATQVLLTTVWPRKLQGWDEYLLDQGSTGVNFNEIRRALAAGESGPWDGASGGEYRSLHLACLVASNGDLDRALAGLDAETLEAFLVGMNSSVGAAVQRIRAWEQRVLDMSDDEPSDGLASS